MAQLDKQVDDAVAPLSQPTSRGFLDDLLTDANGYSFHRFQIFVWTIVLAILFIRSVYESLSMPEFGETFLALMGIIDRQESNVSGIGSSEA